MSQREVRSISELRAAENTGTDLVLEGYAARFNNFSRNLGGFIERIAPGTFTRSLSERADVMATFNHDPNKPLGRTKSGTLTLEQDSNGLKFRCVLDASSTMHRDLYASVKRGDIDQCSFAFNVDDAGQSWEDASTDEMRDGIFVRRTLTDVNLVDVSAVTYPAYYGTNVDARQFFPDGDVPAIKNAIEARAARSRTDSLEAQAEILRSQLNNALVEQFGYDSDYGTRYRVCETYTDHVIAVSYDEEYNSAFFNLPYVKNGDVFTFGEPKPVELDWVASERTAALAAELRTGNKRLVAVLAKRAAEKSYNDLISEVDGALGTAFPGEATLCGGQYWSIDTFTDHVIVCDYKADKYFDIPYVKDADGKITFGEAKEVEQTWTPTGERAIARVAELKAKREAPVVDPTIVADPAVVVPPVTEAPVVEEVQRLLPFTEDEVRARKAKLAGLMF